MENPATTQPESKGSSNDELRVVAVITEEPRIVQHVAKASSDQLLRKFAADSDEESPPAKRKSRMPKRRRRSRWSGDEEGKENCDQSPSTNGNNCSLVERKSLLPTTVTRKSTLLRQLGIARSQLRARDIRNKSLMRAIQKTWRQTVEGASRVFIERHYNRHNRLINDSV